jgi:hypothetical protein
MNMNNWWKNMHNIIYYECLLPSRLECDRPSTAKGYNIIEFAELLQG